MLPDLVPTLSIACSMFLVVRIPKLTGTSGASETEAMTLATSEATRLK